MNIAAMLTAQFHARQSDLYDLERRISYFALVAAIPGFQRFWDRTRSGVREDVHEHITSLAVVREDAREYFSSLAKGPPDSESPHS